MAQNLPNANVKISFNTNNVSISEYSQIVKNQSGYNISYNPDEISPHLILKFYPKNLSIQQSLDYLKKEYNITYKIKGNTIILIKKNKGNSIVSSKKTSKNKRNNKENQIKKSDFNKGSTTSLNNISNTTFDYKKEEEKFIPSERIKTERTYKRSFLHQLKKAEINSFYFGNNFKKWENKNIKNNFHLNLGVQLEETFYFNPFIEFGYKNIMLTGFYSNGVNGTSHFRYGLKQDIELNEKSRIGIEFNYGIFHKPLFFTHTLYIPEDDSLGTAPIYEYYEYKFQTQNQLYKGGFIYQYMLSNKLDFKIGMYWNVLHVEIKNFNDEITVRPYEMHPSILENITPHDFSTVHPPFDFYNNFNLQNSNYTRMWLGAHIGLRYRFLR